MRMLGSCLLTVLLLSSCATSDAPESMRHTPRATGEKKPVPCGGPQYPDESVKNHEQGTTKVAVLISKEGRPLKVEVKESSGYRRLDDATVAGFWNCKFMPAIVNGEPQEAWGNLKFTWKIDDGPIPPSIVEAMPTPAPPPAPPGADIQAWTQPLRGKPGEVLSRSIEAINL